MDLAHKRVLVVVAHPDDETGGCGVLLQRLHQATVVFCTDGAPMQAPRRG
jgi:LmbE family N-acetylglucosaminyl deacetylase